MMESSAEKTIRIDVSGSEYLPIDSLTPFQGELKTLEREEYLRCRESILKNGFSFAIHVWRDQGVNYIIDGHQRIFALRKMREQEGYSLPEIPIVIVQAPNMSAAKLKVLAGVSVYGKMTNDSVASYLKENEISFRDVIDYVKLPSINEDKLLESLTELMKNQQLPTVEGDLPEMRSSSDQVRQVVLFFDSSSHAEFMQFIEKMMAVYNKQNVTDVVMECVRAAYRSKLPVA